MNTTLRIGAAALLVTALGLQGCATGSNSNSAYTSYQAQREQTVRFGTVESVRNVVIDREQTGVGTLAGGAVGGIGSAAPSGAATARWRQASWAPSRAASPAAPSRAR